MRERGLHHSSGIGIETQYDASQELRSLQVVGRPDSARTEAEQDGQCVDLAQVVQLGDGGTKRIRIKNRLVRNGPHQAGEQTPAA